MAAPTHKPLLLLLLASACASTDMTHEPRPQTADAARSSPAAGVTPAVDDDLADLEASLEVYEQQLASNEARLRAMGVMVATRDDTALAPQAEAPGRFAPPPPAAPATTSKPTAPSRSYADEDQASAQSRRPQKEAEKDKKRAAKSPSAGAGKSGTTSASSPAPSPAPRRDAGSSPGDAHEAKQDADKPEDRHGRCAELCDLADSTCELEGKICDLAARHQGDVRYAEVCRRADEDCRIAAEACTLCSP
jgi:hypothetical protein